MTHMMHRNLHEQKLSGGG